MDPDIRTLLHEMQRRSDDALAVLREEMRGLRNDLRSGMSGFGDEVHGELAGFQDELRGQMAGLRDEVHGELAGFQDELRGQMAGLRDEVHGELAGFRDELRGEMAGLRDEVHGEVAGLRDDVRSEIVDLRSEIHRLDVKVDETAVATRRHFDVVAEALRQEIRTVAEGVASNAGQLDRATAEIRAEMAAGFTVVGAAFIQVRRDLDDLRAGS